MALACCRLVLPAALPGLLWGTALAGLSTWLASRVGQRLQRLGHLDGQGAALLLGKLVLMLAAVGAVMVWLQPEPLALCAGLGCQPLGQLLTACLPAHLPTATRTS